MLICGKSKVHFRQGNKDRSCDSQQEDDSKNDVVFQSLNFFKDMVLETCEEEKNK